MFFILYKLNLFRCLRYFFFVKKIIRYSHISSCSVSAIFHHGCLAYMRIVYVITSYRCLFFSSTASSIKICSYHFSIVCFKVIYDISWLYIVHGVPKNEFARVNLRCSRNACKKVHFDRIFFGLNSRQNHLWLNIIFLWCRHTSIEDEFSLTQIRPTLFLTIFWWRNFEHILGKNLSF